MTTKLDIPEIELTRIKLVSVSYTNIVYPNTQLNEGELFTSLRLHSKKKNSFKVRLIEEIVYNTLKFKSKHDAEFSSGTPISGKIYNSETFRKQILDILLPFNTELFAHLSTKSLGTPIIVPSVYLLKDEQDNT